MVIFGLIEKTETMAKVKVKVPIGAKHSYRNPRLFPTPVIDKRGNLTIRLKNPRKKVLQKYPFDIKLLSEKHRIALQRWTTDSYYGEMKMMYYYKSGVLSEKGIRDYFYLFHDVHGKDLMEHDYFRYIYNLTEDLDDVFRLFKGSGQETIYRGIYVREDNYVLGKDTYVKDIMKYYNRNIKTILDKNVGEEFSLTHVEPTSWTANPYMGLSFATNKKTLEDVYSIVKLKMEDDLIIFEPIDDRQLYSLYNMSDKKHIENVLLIAEGDLAKAGYNISELSIYPEEEEVLLPPFKGKFVKTEDQAYSFVMYDIDNPAEVRYDLPIRVIRFRPV